MIKKSMIYENTIFLMSFYIICKLCFGKMGIKEDKLNVHLVFNNLH